MKGASHRYVGRQPATADTWYGAAALRPATTTSPDLVARMLRLHADDLDVNGDQAGAEKMRQRADTIDGGTP